MSWSMALYAWAIVFMGVHQDYDRWVEVTSTASGTVWYLDVDRSNLSGTRPRAWFRLDHSRNRSERARSTVQLIEFDCDAFRARTTSATDYYPDGTNRLVRGASEYARFEEVVPGSVLEGALTAVCRVSRGR